MSKTSPGMRGSPEISSTRQSSEELGADKKVAQRRETAP